MEDLKIKSNLQKQDYLDLIKNVEGEKSESAKDVILKFGNYEVNAKIICGEAYNFIIDGTLRRYYYIAFKIETKDIEIYGELASCDKIWIDNKKYYMCDYVSALNETYKIKLMCYNLIDRDYDVLCMI